MDLKQSPLEREQPLERPEIDAAEVVLEVWIPGMLVETIQRLQRKRIH